MNAKTCLWFCMLLLLSTVVLGATARIVADSTAPGCYGFEESRKNCHSLLVAGPGAVTYTIEDVQPDTVYTVSFMYKMSSGSFAFDIPGLPVSSGGLSETTWTQFSATFTTEDSVPAPFRLRFTPSGSARFYLDEVQMTPSPEPTKFNNFKYDIGCCPFDYCWTGGAIKEHPSCIHDDFYEMNVSMPPIGWSLADFKGNPDNAASFLDAPNGYRCINGSWEFARAKFTPLYDGAGYCPHDFQCYNGHRSGKPAQACTESGSFVQYSGVESDQPVEYFYCHEGNWTTRTKEIALQMLNMANRSADNDYTIFCDKFDRSLNPDETLSYYRDYVGDNIVALLTSGIVNEFCVMVLNGQVIAGVSLNNIEVNETLEEGEEGCVKGGWACLTPGNCDPETECLLGDVPPELKQRKSFLQMLKGPDANTYCDVVLSDPALSDGKYYACNNKDVYYNPKLKSVIFSRTTDPPQDVPFEEVKTFIEVIFDYLKQLFRNLLGIAGLPRPATELVQADQLGFIQSAGSFDKLYISYSPDGPGGNPRSINAVRETRAFVREDVGVNYRTFISAEYRNYQTDMCRGFFYKHNYNDLRDQISGNSQIQCTPVILNASTNEWMYSIYVEEPVFELGDDEADLRPVRVWKGASDTFWNDITAKIRTQPAPPLSDSSLSVPVFEVLPESPVAGAEMTFSITSPEDAAERWIARTWDFGDGMQASSAYNVTAAHVYMGAKDYDVLLCVMNDAFRIRCSPPTTITVREGPSVSVVEEEGADATALDFEFRITGGNPPYTIRVEWGDDNFDNTTSELADTSEVFEYSVTPEANVFTATHTYPRSASYQVNVTGADGTGDRGVQYSVLKVVVV